MSEQLKGSVNGIEVKTHPGMKVKHALIALDTGLYEACREGRTVVRDGNGFVVGLDGALHNGFQLFTGEAVDSKGTK